jgi:signal transduction histidine kinase
VAISAFEGDQLAMRQVAIVGLAPEQYRQWRAERQRQPEQTASEGMPPEMLARLQAGESLVLDMTQPPYNTQPNPYETTTALIMPMLTRERLVGLLVVDYLERGADGRNRVHHFTREETQLTEAVARLGAVVLDRERLLREREAIRTHTLALEEANRRMDEFIGIAGHELRTPLTSVKANVQLAERRARSLVAELGDSPVAGAPLARLVHLLANVSAGVDRQERLVRDLLDISRISSGKLNYRMAPCELNALVRETTQELLLTATARVINLDLPSVPVMALADADRVRQVLTNYLTNALRYAPPGCPIVVALRHDETLARVTVADQGPGLSPEQQRGLFERFYRAEGIEALSGSGVGLGLGLYISRMIVERHGGAVGVESAVGAGATFWFTLPLLGSEA